MTKETKPAATRRYVVVDAKGNERLVRATGLAQAISHVYEPAVHVASQDDLIRLLTAGAVDEDAMVPKSGNLPGL